jgi:hypothetical protein
LKLFVLGIWQQCRDLLGEDSRLEKLHNANIRQWRTLSRALNGCFIGLQDFAYTDWGDFVNNDPVNCLCSCHPLGSVTRHLVGETRGGFFSQGENGGNKGFWVGMKGDQGGKGWRALRVSNKGLVAEGGGVGEEAGDVVAGEDVGEGAEVF